MSTATRERLERTARIVAGGTCPHALARASVKTVWATYCDKAVDPLTGDHVDGTRSHQGDSGLSVPTRWYEDDPGALIE